MKRREIPKAFPPSECLREELEERGWDVAELAKKIGQPIKVVRGIVAGWCPISPKMANRLGKAFGTSAEMWLNLQRAYDIQEELKSAREKR